MTYTAAQVAEVTSRVLEMYNNEKFLALLKKTNAEADINKVIAEAIADELDTRKLQYDYASPTNKTVVNVYADGELIGHVAGNSKRQLVVPCGLDGEPLGEDARSTYFAAHAVLVSTR